LQVDLSEKYIEIISQVYTVSSSHNVIPTKQ